MKKSTMEIMSKTKNNKHFYSKLQTLMSYFDEWEQSLIVREENLSQNSSLHDSQPKKPKISEPDIEKDEEFSSNEHLLNNFKLILNEKEQEIHRLKSNIDEKEHIIIRKTKEIAELQQKSSYDSLSKTKSNKLVATNNENKENFLKEKLKEKENQLDELNKDLENKKLEVINMWDEVISKAEVLEQKEKENEIKRNKLEQKQIEYEQLVQRINEEKATFFQTQAYKTEEDKEKEKKLAIKEREIFEKERDLENRQRDFFGKVKKIYEMIRTLNQTIKSPGLESLMKDEFFANNTKENTIFEQLSSFNTSLNRSNSHFWSNSKENQENHIAHNDEHKINDIPNFNKIAQNDSNLLNENSFNLIKNSMSFSNNLDIMENSFNHENTHSKELNLYLPFQGKNK